MGTLFTVSGTTGDVTTAGSITSTSTTSGFLPPVLTTTQRNAIVSPATGLEVFNSTTNQLEFWNGSAWMAVGSGGSGTVTSVALTVPTFLSVSGSPVTTSGTLAVTLSGTALPVLNGGTGTTTSTGTGSVVLSTSPTLTTPNLGTPSALVLTNATGTPSSIGLANGTGLSLTTGVTGILPIANGGTDTATPSLVAGTNVTITGSWPNQTVNSTGGGSPAGSNTQIQFNNSGAFGASSNLIWNGTTETISGNAGVAGEFLILQDTPSSGGNPAFVFNSDLGGEIDFNNAAQSTSFAVITVNASGNLAIQSVPNNVVWTFDNTGLLTTPAGGGGAIQLQDQAFVEFDDTSSNSVSIAAPATVNASYNLYWPNVQATGTQFLQNDGSGNLSWSSSTAIPAGSDTQIQYNNAGTFGASSLLVWDNSSSDLIVDGTISIVDEQSLNFYHGDTGSQVTTLAVGDDDSFTILVAGLTAVTIGAGWVQIPFGIADPPSPIEGVIWYNTTSHSWRGYNGTSMGTFTFTAD